MDRPAVRVGVVLLVGTHWWTIANAAILSAAFVIVVATPRRLTDAWHVAELADKLRGLEAQAIKRVVTTLGIHATVARLDTPAGPVRDFIVSAPDAAAPLAEADVARLAAAVGFDGAVVRPATTPRLFHVLVSGHNRP